MSKKPSDSGRVTESANAPGERDDALVQFVLGELSSEESSALARRIAEDPELANDARTLMLTFEAIGANAHSEPPAELRDRILAAAAERRRPQQSARRPTVVRPARFFDRARFATAAAAAAMIFLALAIGIAIDDYRLRRELALLEEVTDTLHQPNVVVSFSLEGSGESPSAYGRATLDLDAKKAALVVSGLAPLEKDQSYWLWAIVGDKAIPCGRFEASDDERIVRQFVIPVEDYTEPVQRLIITVEPFDAKQPSGPTIMSSSTTRI